MRLVLLFLLLGGGCGYTTKTVLPQNIQTIYVETFKNKLSVGQLYAYEPGLETEITNAVIRRLHRDGNLKVVKKAQADAVLEGNLVRVDQEGLRFTGLERIEEYRLFLVVDLRLVDRKTGGVLWEEKDFSGDTTYFVTGPRAVSRTEAFDKAVDRLARNIVDRVVEDW